MGVLPERETRTFSALRFVSIVCFLFLTEDPGAGEGNLLSVELIVALGLSVVYPGSAP